jgi:hypothetical protein
MKKILILCIVALPAWGIAQKARTAIGATTAAKAPVSRLDSMLSKTGYEFSNADDNVFVAKQEGKNLKDIIIIATETDGLTVLLTVVKEKATANMTLAHYKQILKLTLEFDKVKIGLDDDESLMIRIDMTSRTMDVEELTENIAQIGAACDEAYGVLLKK